jgi:hypothetical protein
MSYIDQHFDELVAQFPTPESATRLRMRPVLVATFRATLEAVKLGGQYFKDHSDSEYGGPGVREGFDRELEELIERLKVYRDEILPLEIDLKERAEGQPGGWQWKLDGQSVDPEALAPKSLAGLVKRRQLDHPDGLKAGPVPDAAMAQHLLERIGILQTHANDLDKALWNDLLLGIPKWIEKVVEIVKEGFSAGVKIAAGVLGAVVLAAGVLAAVVLIARTSSNKPQTRAAD